MSAPSLRLRELLACRAGHLALAALLSALALLAAFGLLAFSGHFITATAIAGGSAATAVLFDIFRPGATIRLFAIVRTAGRYGERLVSHEAVLRLLASLRERLYAQLAALTPEPLARWSEGDLLQRVVGDVDAVAEAPLRAGLPLAGAVVVVIAALLVVAVADVSLLVPAALGLLAAGLLPIATAWRSGRDGAALAQYAARRRAALVDALRGLTTLSLCGAWPAWREHWLADDAQLLRAQFVQRLRESVGQALSLLLLGGAAVALLARADTAGVGTAQAPWIAAAVLGLLASWEALAPSTAAWLAWGRARAALQRLDALVATPPTVSFPDRADVPAACGRLELDEAGYRYAGRDGGLAPTTSSLAPGARLLVYGASGAGKSTLAALLSRSLDPQQGRVLLDGVDLRDYDEASLRTRVALLPQRPHLFAATVAENLRVADADADDARLRAVLQAVALDAWLARLPQGLETPLGEYGVGLSGGEARRLALARTLLRPAVLFVLDEPYEGLDAPLRQRVAAGVDRWIGAATLVLISHHEVVLPTTATTLHLRPREIVQGAPSAR
ncbi:thiol reductant ABC exporter subunit CydC [Tahibacter sp. UC22_41]|uniref:thiol reductant ABC exporter subunit CydC n=1 Tax=Tahibacter sp. UC22_41 TaxID=3350178 RepID=UPI0036DF8242